jgi:glycopeptide antibiotics resistance protein
VLSHAVGKVRRNVPASIDMSQRSYDPSRERRVPLIRPIATLLLLAYVPVVLALLWSPGTEVASAEDNLIPFATIRAVWNDTAPPGVLTQAVGNVLLFVPLGFLARRAFPRVAGTVLVVFIAVAAAAAEYYQGKYVAGRIIDVDDAILGAVGGFLGVLLGGWRRARPRWILHR